VIYISLVTKAPWSDFITTDKVSLSAESDWFWAFVPEKIVRWLRDNHCRKKDKLCWNEEQ